MAVVREEFNTHTSSVYFRLLSNLDFIKRLASTRSRLNVSPVDFHYNFNSNTNVQLSKLNK